jgi:hypothetical protein
LPALLYERDIAQGADPIGTGLHALCWCSGPVIQESKRSLAPATWRAVTLVQPPQVASIVTTAKAIHAVDGHLLNGTDSGLAALEPSTV